MQTMEFVPSGTQPTDAQRAQRLLYGLFTVLLIVAIVATSLLLQVAPNVDVDAPTLWAVLRDRLWSRLQERGIAWPAAAVGALSILSWPLAHWYFGRALPQARLVLDATGVHHRPVPLPGPLQALDPAWSIAWRDLARVEHGSASSAAGPLPMRGIVLVDRAGARRHLLPLRWERKGEPAPEIEPMRVLLRDHAAEDARFAAHPLVAALAARGLAPRLAEASQTPWWRRDLTGASFDIGASRPALWALGVALLLAVYGVGELVMDRHRFALPAPEHWFVALGAVAAGIGFALLRGRALPLVEGIVIAALVGVGAGLAARPLALRLNALSDGDGVEIVHCRLGVEGVVVAEGAGGARFELPARTHAYWSAFRPDDRYPLAVHRGWLGVWQLDTAPIHAELAAYRGFGRGREAQAAARAHARRILAPEVAP